MHPLIACLLAFATAIAIDYAYSNWIISVTKRRETSACIYSGAITLLGGCTTFLFLDHWYTLFPAALGHALGTKLAMRRDRGSNHVP